MTVVTESNLYSHVKLYGALQCAQRQLAGLHSLKVRIHKAEKHSRALRTVTAALKTEMCTVDSTFLGEEVKQTKTRPLWGDSGRKNQHLFLWNSAEPPERHDYGGRQRTNRTPLFGRLLQVDTGAAPALLSFTSAAGGHRSPRGEGVTWE